MRRIISITLSIVMLFCVASVKDIDTKNIYAQETAWEGMAIISPTEGELVGAGYINIKIDTTLENAESYTVYFDGKDENQLVDGNMANMTFEAKDGITQEVCEVYSVAVKNAHTVYVVANLKDGSSVTSDTRTFYISKKGLAMGGDMSDTVKIGKLNISWYYNWATTAFNNSVDEGVAHVPMVWGAAQSNLKDIKNITDDSNYVLGYNEPDIPSQANLSAGKALAAWKYVEALGKRTVSPALAVYTGGFMDKFLKTGDTYDPSQEPEEEPSTDEGEETTTDDGEVIELPGGFYAAVDVDAVALHRYGGSKTGTDPDLEVLTSAIDWLWDKYHKPIWVTEVSVTGKKGAFSDWSYEQPGALERMKKYVAKIIEAMDADDRVERYAWFPYNVESINEIDGLDGCGTTALFDYATGKFTELGVMYSEMGNPNGYKPQVISNDEKYVWEKSTTAVETTNQNSTVTVTDKTQEITVKKPDEKKPSMVKIKRAKNIKKKSVALKWSKVSNAKRYQVQYSLNKKFKNAKKYKTKKVMTTKLQYTVKKLIKKKTYYFRVRGVNGNYYGKWSKIKKVKVKK